MLATMLPWQAVKLLQHLQRSAALALWDRRGAAAAVGPPGRPSAQETLPCTAMPATAPLARICKLRGQSGGSVTQLPCKAHVHSMANMQRDAACTLSLKPARPAGPLHCDPLPCPHREQHGRLWLAGNVALEVSGRGPGQALGRRVGTRLHLDYSIWVPDLWRAQQGWVAVKLPVVCGLSRLEADAGPTIAGTAAQAEVTAKHGQLPAPLWGAQLGKPAGIALPW